MTTRDHPSRGRARAVGRPDEGQARRQLLSIWCRCHGVAGAAAGCCLVATVAWAMGASVVGAQIENPLGRSFVPVRLSVLLPAVACAVAGTALHDRLPSRFALAARPQRALRAAWLVLVTLAAAASLLPAIRAIGVDQLVIDVGLLMGLSAAAMTVMGLAAAQAVALIVVVPHVLVPDGVPPPWWAVLGGGHPPVHALAATVAGAGGLVVYTCWGPRSRPTFSEG